MCFFRDERGQTVVPIFYGVDPSDVRKQKRKYGEAFSKHELSENDHQKIKSWRKALFAGWEPRLVANGHGAKCIKEIVGSVLDKLSSLDAIVHDENLVGMGTRLQDLKSQLRMGSGGVRMVGIWGVGGGGKTTLATSLYMEISANFNTCCFVGNIREDSSQHNGLKNLQEKILLTAFHKKLEVPSVDIGKHMIKRMLHRRNVLIVLDDLDQLEALAGGHDWFGDGSRIIITTRDEHVLISHGVDLVSPINLLSRNEAIRLFRRYAYHKNNPVEDYDVLSLRVISYVDLALKIIGSFLNGKDKIEWNSALEKLKDIPNSKVMEQLKISYDGLDLNERELFLDIACFFRGKRKEEAMAILDACGFHPRIGVKVLIQKALITISSNGYFDMHDLVQEMGHYIVRGEHPDNPEKHSRVWRKEDIEDILYRNATMENHTIEGILDFDRSPRFNMLVPNLKRLRFLSVDLYWGKHAEPTFFSNELKYIKWDGYPASLFPESFQPTKLVVLKLHRTLQKDLWKGYKLPYLKELELTFARSLVKTPDFTGLPCLQKLTLGHCKSLEEIDPSLGYHTSLVYVSVRNCKRLTRFPTIVRMKKLEILKITDCKALLEIPQIKAFTDSLLNLHLNKVGIEGLPSSVHQNLPCLKELELTGANALVRTPDFAGLPCLQKLTLDDCDSLEEIDPSLGHHTSLVYVYVRKCKKLTRFPTIVRMEKLETFKIIYCTALLEFPKIEANMDRLENIELAYVGIEVLPSSIGRYCTNLISLRFVGCCNLKSIEGNFHELKRLQKFELHGKTQLEKLHVSLVYGGEVNIFPPSPPHLSRLKSNLSSYCRI